MAETPSNMIPLKTKAPGFQLLNPRTGKIESLEKLRSDRATVIVFLSNHCPFVKHIIPGLVDFAKDYIPKGISLIAINSNDVKNYPEDSPEKMAEYSKKYEYPFSYLFDETQETAKAYKAACTPDFYLFNGELELEYRGQFDDARPGNNAPVTGADLRQACDLVLAGKPAQEEQKPSIGCNIKWKK
ncbi:MAG: thioredoxin family protein [Candidatus Kapaibacterium sp.]